MMGDTVTRKLAWRSWTLVFLVVSTVSSFSQEPAAVGFAGWVYSPKVYSKASALYLSTIGYSIVADQADTVALLVTLDPDPARSRITVLLNATKTAATEPSTNTVVVETDASTPSSWDFDSRRQSLTLGNDVDGVMKQLIEKAIQTGTIQFNFTLGKTPYAVTFKNMQGFEATVKLVSGKTPSELLTAEPDAPVPLPPAPGTVDAPVSSSGTADTTKASDLNPEGAANNQAVGTGTSTPETGGQ